MRIENFSSLEGGWSVSLDGSRRKDNIATEAFRLKSLRAGQYQISVSGKIKDAAVSASESVEVKPGKLHRASLLLKEARVVTAAPQQSATSPKRETQGP